MAIKALSFLVSAFDKPIYCYHEIVHNKIVVDRFKNQGVIFVDSIDEVPPNAIVMLSAHGSAPQVVDTSKQDGRVSVNAVCPLVTKVHHEAKTRTRKGFEIIYVGHEGHDEALGTMAVAPENIHLVTDEDSLEDVARSINPDSQVALLAQTTLAMSEWKNIEELAKEKYPQMWTAGKSDLCFATTNRQHALIELSKVCNVLIIIGSANSSNTLALEKVAKETGCERVYRINSVSDLSVVELRDDDIVGVTAGASAPEDVVQDIVNGCNPIEGVEILKSINEEEYFPPPSQLRELAIDLNFAIDNIFKIKHDLAASNTRNSQQLNTVFKNDRNLDASSIF